MLGREYRSDKRRRDESEEEEKGGGDDKKASQEDEVETETGRARKREGWWR